MWSRCTVFFQKLVFALFDQRSESNAPIGRDLNTWHRPTNAHGGDGGVDFHVAAAGDVAGDKGERALGQAKKGRIGFAVWVVDELVQHHACITVQVKRCAVGKGNAEPPITSRLNYVSKIDGGANFCAIDLVAKRYHDNLRFGMRDGGRTFYGYDLSNGFYPGILSWRLSVLRPRGC